MFKRLITASVVALAFGAAQPASAAEVTGTLVDHTCYMKDKSNTGNAHKGMSETCAQDCAKKGATVALVTAAGEVYEVMAMGELSAASNAKLVPHMSHKVTLTGDITDGAAGRPKMIHATALKMAK
jgi:hypothetical protein